MNKIVLTFILCLFVFTHMGCSAASIARKQAKIVQAAPYESSSSRTWTKYFSRHKNYIGVDQALEIVLNSIVGLEDPQMIASRFKSMGIRRNEAWDSEYEDGYLCVVFYIRMKAYGGFLIERDVWGYAVIDNKSFQYEGLVVTQGALTGP